ncbi:MAG: L,D-transpeptidase [bacterium]|nr:L,D-transpeptidase [bacterium]
MVWLLVILPTAWVVYLFLTPAEPNEVLLRSAKLALETARTAGAVRYSESLFRDAEKLINAGWMEMSYQNGRLAPLRDYEKSDSLLMQAIKTASEATTNTQQSLSDLRTTVHNERQDLKDELNSWLQALNGSLAKLSLNRYWSMADLSAKQADRLVVAGEYADAREEMALSRTWLAKLATSMDEYNDQDSQFLKVWRRWVAETVADSRATGGSAIIVDKARHKLFLIKGGAVIHTYNCELGYNAGHQKMFSGDGATPEGKYRISAYRPRGSRYYKALNINYPNDTDRKRFSDNKSKGIISQRARIGGLIEIHGHGGQGKDWTEGCVALTNNEMDHLMKYVANGTPVTIVRRSDQWP